MLDVICIGAATEDIFFFSDQFKVRGRDLLLPWKEKFTVEGLERRLGGGAFNASAAFSRLGLKAAFFGRVGNDRAGRTVKEFLEEEGVSTEFLIVDPEVKTSTSALLSKAGERTIVMYRGRNDNLLEVNPPWRKIFGARWIFLAELAGTNHDFVFELVKRLEGKKTRLSYIPGQRELDLGREKLKSILARADILICNRYEAGRILVSSLPPQHPVLIKKHPAQRGGVPRQVEEMLIAFKDLGVGIPVITSGSEGSVAYDGERVYRQGATPKVEVIDRTGAGDAFASTFTAGIVLGKPIPESLLMAAKNASSVITHVGGMDGLLSLSQLSQ